MEMKFNLRFDWRLLRTQKRLLVGLQSGKIVTNDQAEAVEGILNLLDAIQDQSVERGYATSREVFGK